MIGWNQPLDEWRAPKGVVAVSVSQSFPDSARIRDVLSRGIAARPDDVWVIREAPASNHAVSIAWAVLREHGIEPFLAAPSPGMKRRDVWKKTVKVPLDECEQDKLTFTEYVPGGFDVARAYADAELFTTCERFVIFHDGRSETTKSLIEKEHSVARVFVITAGKPKPKQRKARKRVET